MKHKYTNALIHSTSSYLLQHAHNPVNWQPWSDEALQEAKTENKLILVSIGYAACHWCHVMEHESFEIEDVAKVMNENFVCIKVDREERPDVDHYYMTAVQLMQQQGGWPLNVIALPDGRPVWGGTYFQKETWMKNISAVAEFHKKAPQQTTEYATELQNGISRVSLIDETGQEETINPGMIERAVNEWKEKFDMARGGRRGFPKFPMPVNHEFLLYYGFLKQDKTVLEFVKTTLTEMARGGIYDQIGGGFARYSVDDRWKVPHFEKMLYDNAQLISLYSKGYQMFGDEEFKAVVVETVDFLERELMNDSGAFYSSLDADSEGVEGKFYVWKPDELKAVLKDDYELFAEYYNVNSEGFWEHGNYILLRNRSDDEFAADKNISPEKLRVKVKSWKEKLLNVRAARVRPGLDDKTIISWNALLIQGLADAFVAFQDERFLRIAEKSSGFLKKNIMQPDGKLVHTWKNGQAGVDGFLEDYAFVIQAFISLFEIAGNENWLQDARLLFSYSENKFFNSENGLFYYAEKEKSNGITNHFQNEDNVVPAANSVMANNLHKLYLILGEPDYLQKATRMLKYIIPQFPQYPMAFANWGNLMLKITEPFFEIVVCGKDAKILTTELYAGFRPNVLLAISTQPSDIPLFRNRFVAGKTLIYVCQEGVCRLPVETVSEALKMIETQK